MAQLGPRQAATNDLYTMLLILAAVLLIAGTIFLAVKSNMLFGSPFPVSPS